MILIVLLTIIIVISLFYYYSRQEKSSPSTKVLYSIDTDMQTIYNQTKETMSPYPYISWGAGGLISLNISESEKQDYEQIGKLLLPLLNFGKAIGHNYMHLSFIVGLDDWKTLFETYLIKLQNSKQELPGLLSYLEELLTYEEDGIIVPFFVSPNTIIERAEQLINLLIMFIQNAIDNDKYTLEDYQTFVKNHQEPFNEFASWIFFTIEGRVHLILTKYLNYLINRGVNIDDVFFVGSNTIPSAPSGSPAPRGTGDHNDMVPHLQSYGINIDQKYMSVPNATTDSISPIKDIKTSDLFASRAWPTTETQEASDGLYAAVINPQSTLAQFPITIPNIDAGTYYNSNGPSTLNVEKKRKTLKPSRSGKCPFR